MTRKTDMGFISKSVVGSKYTDATKQLDTTHSIIILVQILCHHRLVSRKRLFEVGKRIA